MIALMTAGLGTALVERMKEALPNFTHKTFNSPAGLTRDAVIVVDESAGAPGAASFSLPDLRRAAHPRSLILCTSDASRLTEEDLACLDDVWAKPLTPPLLDFYLRRLQSGLEEGLRDREYQRRLLEMARQDCLTGLATRWYLQEYVEDNKNERLTCIYFDLDRFKEVNDTWGHQAGDKALAATAEMLQREFAEGFVARLGGDEFMVILKQPLDGVEEKVNAFLTKLMDYYKGTPFMRGLSISAGIASASGRPQGRNVGIDQLIHESDCALYCAKESGRACCRVYSPLMEGKGK